MDKETANKLASEIKGRFPMVETNIIPSTYQANPENLRSIIGVYAAPETPDSISNKCFIIDAPYEWQKMMLVLQVLGFLPKPIPVEAEVLSKVVEVLLNSPLCSLSEIAEAAGIEPAVARRALEELDSQGKIVFDCFFISMGVAIAFSD